MTGNITTNAMVTSFVGTQLKNFTNSNKDIKSTVRLGVLPTENRY